MPAPCRQTCMVTVHNYTLCPETACMLLPAYPSCPQAFFAELKDVDRDNEVNRILWAFKLNPFEKLNLRFDAAPEEVRKQFRKLSLMVHPDKCKHPQASAAFDSECWAWSSVWVQGVFVVSALACTYAAPSCSSLQDECTLPVSFPCMLGWQLFTVSLHRQLHAWLIQLLFLCLWLSYSSW